MNGRVDSSVFQLSPQDLSISSSSSLSPPSGMLAFLVNGNGNGHNYGPLQNHTGASGGKAAAPSAQQSSGGTKSPSPSPSASPSPSRRRLPTAELVRLRECDPRVEPDLQLLRFWTEHGLPEDFRTAVRKAQLERSAGGFVIAGDLRVIH